MIKNDKWIKEQAAKGMIAPFRSELVKKVCGTSVISYGLGSYGYDIKLSPKDFRVFKRIPGEIVDPKRFDIKSLEPVKLQYSEDGTERWFILPAKSYALGVAYECLNIPDNITVICIGKSTYARCGIIANLTPAEAGWRGYLTLELSNSSDADCKIYANEGIVQIGRASL